MEEAWRIALLRTKVVKHRHDDQRSYRHPSQYSPLITPWWIEADDPPLITLTMEFLAHFSKCEYRGIHPQHPRSLESHTPSPRPLKERLEFLTEQASNEGRTSSRDRRSALARIAEPDVCGNPLHRGSLLFESTCLSCLGGVLIPTVALSSVPSPYGLKLSGSARLPML
ncbi:hypothetical protein F2Q70_00038758 [Brassica cretica]|uniref:Uncharacterized protein n=1 Tax=Brassica cretica TaxID=69181 RepID=A0A8S9K2Z7_BRACR|nr:hypothetical protein F2Q70_00038758 [Brassica cretica]